MAEHPEPVIERARELLIAQAIEFLGDRNPEAVARFRSRARAIVAETSAEDLARIVHRVQTTGSEWTYYPPEPLARRLHYAMADFALAEDSRMEGAQHLARVQGEPALVFLCNHLSYADANLFEILLHRHGFDDVTARLTVIAGPKVYSEAFRRFLSLCFGTIKTPQSSERASGEALMTYREVARVARTTIGIARDRQRAGEHLLIFVEGTRSRTRQMQPALAAVARYFDPGPARLVPVAITGSERLVPVGDEHVHPATVTLRIGPSFAAEELLAQCGGNRSLMMNVVGLKIAEQLPAHYRGAYADDAPNLEAARTAASRLSVL